MTAHSVPATRANRRRRPRPKTTLSADQRWLVAEICLKLGLNGILVLGSIAALAKLIPFQHIQQAKLHEVQMQVQETEQRVAELRGQFQRSFDPRQAKKIMVEQTPRIAPNQRRIIFMNPSQPTTANGKGE